MSTAHSQARQAQEMAALPSARLRRRENLADVFVAQGMHFVADHNEARPVPVIQPQSSRIAGCEILTGLPDRAYRARCQDAHWAQRTE